MNLNSRPSTQQYYKNSFQEFNKQYRYESLIMRNKAQKLKNYDINDVFSHHSSQSRPKPNNDPKAIIGAHKLQNKDIKSFIEHVSKIANVNLTGNTFDANHMDQFLKTNEFSNVSSKQTTKNTMFTQNMISNNPDADQKKKRHFSSRVDDNKNYTKTDFDDQYTDKNVLVTVNTADPHQNQKFFENNFLQDKLHYDTSSLQIQSYQTRQLQSSHQMRTTNQQVSDKQKEFKHLKQQHLFTNKKKRVIDNAYRSGIVNIDHPYYQGTRLYKDQLQGIKQKEQQRKNYIEIKRHQQQKYRSTNPQLEMMNQKKMQTEHIESEYFNRINCIWQHKKRVDQTSTSSHNKLFGKGKDDKFKGLDRNNLEKHRSINIITQVKQTKQ